jgi:hypothetical protein
VGFFVLVPPAGASADPARPGNTESIVESVEPSTDSVRIDIVGGDAFVRLRVERGHSAELRGYYDEPYVRVADDGTVSVNEASDTFRISKSRYGAGTTINDGGSASIDESWVVASTNGTYLWHDHRVHWMSPMPPQAIDGRGLVQQWSIPITVDGRATLVTGSLYLRDAPGSWWWLFLLPAVVIGFTASRVVAVRALVIGGVATAVGGAFMFWGLPTEARGAPLVFLLGIVAGGVAFVAGLLSNRSEISDALGASAALSLVVATIVERDAVTNRFVPGLGDVIVVRCAVPVIAGIAVGAGARAVKRLLDKPESIAST